MYINGLQTPKNISCKLENKWVSNVTGRWQNTASHGVVPSMCLATTFRALSILDILFQPWFVRRSRYRY